MAEKSHPRETRPQRLDDLAIFSLREDPDRWESLIRQENQLAETDPIAAQILRSVYWESDRDSAFDRYRNSLDFRMTAKLLKLFSVDPEQSLLEIGGGSGFLSWALVSQGFRDVSLLEPNVHHITGTGYLRTRPDACSIQIENSLEEFYQSDRAYQTVVTRNCVHHFPNVTFAAAAIRQKIKPGGKWIMIREPFVESAHDLYCFLQGHPYSQAYGVFEFGYPAAHYIDALTMAGFKFSSLVPRHYANNALSLFVEEEGNAVGRGFSALMDLVLKRAPGLSRIGFATERHVRRWLRLKAACFSLPQVLVFERAELGEMSSSVIWYRPDTSIEKGGRQAA